MKLSIIPTAVLIAHVGASNPSGWEASQAQSISPAIQNMFPSAHLTPQIINTFLQPNEILLERNSYIYKNGTSLYLNGQRWTAAGANVYWLGLDENVIPPAGQPFYAPFNASYPTHGRITEIMNTLMVMGAHSFRSTTMGVSVGNPLSVMPSLGVYNEAAFDTIDWAVFQARQHGLRIMAPLIDNYDYYHGGKFDFLRFRGFNVTGSETPSQVILQFYTNKTIIQDFKNYIQHLLTHVNPYTGLTYAEDPTIFAYETGNELSAVEFADHAVPVAWTTEIAEFIKSIAPHKLVLDGMYGLNATNPPIAAVDIVSNHFYPLNLSLLESDLAIAQAKGKAYLVGEYDWVGANGGTPLADFLGYIAGRQNETEPVVIGDMFWSLFMHNVPDCSTFVNHSDGFTLQYGGNQPNTSTKISTIREHLFAMQNIVVDSYLPAVACPHNFVPGYDADYTYL